MAKGALSKKDFHFRTNADDFQRTVTKWAPQVNADARTFVQLVALKLYQRIIMNTPVDTGRARGNWQLDIGSAPSGEVDAGKPKKKGQKRRTTRPPLRSGEKKQVVKAEQDLGRLKLGRTIYIGNNLPYITLLEEGSSTQAPHGMVERAMNVIGREFQRGR